jgi:plastocyanin
MDEALVVTWRRLLKWAGIAAIVEYVAVLVMAREVIPPIIVIGLVIGVGVALVARRAGVIVTLVGLVLFLLTNLMFALRDLAEYRSFPSFAVAAASLATAVVGIVAAVVTLRADGPSPKARAIALGTAAAIVGLLAVNALGTLTYDDPAEVAGDVVLVAKDAEWSTESLTAPAGDVTFFLDNRDASLHNFHVKGADTVSLPAAHSARKTMRLAAGTYTYVCDLHPDTMEGKLTVT